MRTEGETDANESEEEREKLTQSGDVGVRDLSGGEEVILLKGGSLVEGSEDLVEEAESSLGPDNESSEVSSGGELEEIEPSNVNELDSGDVSESLDDSVVLVVDDQGSSSHSVPSSSHLSLSSSDLPGVGDLDDVGVSLGSLEESDGLLGLGVGLGGVGDDEGDLLDLLDSVSSSENERGEGRGGESRDDGESLLVLVDLDVPLPPDLGGSEHSSTSAHVSEGGLGEREEERMGRRLAFFVGGHASPFLPSLPFLSSSPSRTRKTHLSSSVGSGSSNTGDTSDGSTSSPRLSRGLLSGVGSDGVSLPLVLSHGLCGTATRLEVSSTRRERGGEEEEEKRTNCEPERRHRA